MRHRGWTARAVMRHFQAKTDINVVHNIFCAHHGRNTCDGATGRVKVKLAHVTLQDDEEVDGVRDLCDFINTKCKGQVAFMLDAKHIQPYLFKPRKKALPAALRAAGLSAVKPFFKATFMKDQPMKLFTTSDEDEPTHTLRVQFDVYTRKRKPKRNISKKRPMEIYSDEPAKTVGSLPPPVPVLSPSEEKLCGWSEITRLTPTRSRCTKMTDCVREERHTGRCRVPKRGSDAVGPAQPKRRKRQRRHRDGR